MFQRLLDLSRTLPRREPWARINEGMPPEYNRGLALCFSPEGTWAGVKTFKKREDAHHPDVVYRSGPPNGTDLTPCCKLAGNTGPRLLRAVENLAGFSGLRGERRTWLERSLAFAGDRLPELWAEVEGARDRAEVDGKERRAFAYWADASGAPVYEWPEAKASMAAGFLQSFSKGGTRAGTCSVCGQDAPEVYGNYSVLACYNLDKRGSIAGGFREEGAHRNLPVCQSCAFAVAEAFAFAETHLTSFMVGQTYLILPYASDDDTRDRLREVIEKRPGRFHLGRAKDLVAEELDLVDELRDRGDQVTFALTFFEAQKAAWRIRADVQQLLPSRLRELHRASEEIARATDLIGQGKEGEEPLRVTASTFRTFSGASARESGGTLRAWLVALFQHRGIDRRHFVHQLVDRIVSTGKANPAALRWATRQAWGLYRYALLTGLIDREPTEEGFTMNEAIPDSAYGRYVREHETFFARPETVVAFLTGCYASKVVYAQFEARKAQPFTKKFLGRLLSREHLQRLYREGHGKLAQYGKLGYVIRDLDPHLAQAWVACGDRWEIDDETATFAFTIGYSLAYRIGKPTEDPHAAGEE